MNNVVVIGLIIAGIIVGTFIGYLVFSTTPDVRNLNGGYLIFDQQEGSIPLDKSWKPPNEVKFYIQGAEKFEASKIKSVIDALISTETVEVPNKYLGGTTGNSTFYKGWQPVTKIIRTENGAEDLPFIRVYDKEDANVVITLTDEKHPSGFDGFTRTIVDTESNRIIAGHVTLYGMNSINPKQIDDLMLHESGHVLGLKHATNPNDLMHHIIPIDLPYISPCDVEAVRHLALNQLDDLKC